MESIMGNRLLTALVDEYALSMPDRLFAVVPKSSAVSDGFRQVTFYHLANAVNAMAWWIEKHCGKCGGRQTIAYMTGNDIRYYIFILACAKTGHTPFLPSTRLSDEAYQHVLNATRCNHMVYSRETKRRTMEIKAFRPETLYIEVPSTTELLDTANEGKHYTFTKTFEELEDEIVFIIHSSGTTGMPKPVSLTHGFLSAWDQAPSIVPAGRRSAFWNDVSPGSMILSVTPNFHLMGLLALIESIFHGLPLVSCADVPLSVQVLTETIQATKPTIAMLPPSILEEMSHSSTASESLSIVKYVISPAHHFLKPQNDENWHYFEWTPAYGVDMQHVQDGLYELVIARQENARAIQGIFHTFPDLDEYHTKDLFTHHPRNTNLWTYHGRLDDVIVLSNGEKLNPVTLEKTIESHPLVSRALLVGEKKFQSALLVQPHWNAVQLNEKEFIDQIWPTIQLANETVPKYGRVMRNNVRLASQDKPFKLTPKGTTQRRAVNKDYENEIEAVYAESAGEIESLPLLDLPSIRKWLQDRISTLLERTDIKPYEDLYAAGLDSLQTVQLAKTLTMLFSTLNPDFVITQQQIYANPTIDQLAAFLLAVIKGMEISSVSRVENIANLVSRYTSNLPAKTPSLPQPPPQLTVILTGSTGSLGTYLLYTLLQNPSIAKIYCLNRSDAQERQIASFKEKALDHIPLQNPQRVQFLTVSFGEPKFGLNDSKYTQLLESVNLVIHNAWKVNFNHPVSSFEDPHLKGVREFIAFSTQSRHRAHIAFISSVATIGGWTGAMGRIVPEKPFKTPDAVLEQGYGESRYIGERMCLEASTVSGVPTSVFRVGQIAGPTTAAGLWNPNEWVPIMLKTSKALGIVPDSLGSYVIDWVPVDTLARIITEICDSRLRSSVKPDQLHAVFHPMNPSKTSWGSLLPAVTASLGVRPVSLTSWVDVLAAIENPSDEDVAGRPALKLLPFFRGLAEGKSLAADIDVERAKSASSSMAEMKPVSADLMANWLKQWGF
ncbi:NRPS-like enzyme [Aspergillus karnatakaensis]|uniref:putative NRPS-like enzyme n=1 Tax=Aspergillus karnatakaensis TaxID=1810916 RepID=UPI003CCC9003